MEGHAGQVSSLAFLPSGNTLISGGVDATIRFWDATSGVMRTTLPNQNTGIKAILADPEGQWIAAAFPGQKTRIWRFSEASENLPDEHFMFGRLDRLAKQGRFEEALKSALDQMEVLPNRFRAWWGAAVLTIKTRDLDGYRQNRREMLSRFGESPDPWSNQLIALVSLIISPDPDQINASIRLADNAIAMEGGRVQVREAHNARHLAEYRSGRYQSAIAMAEAQLAKMRESDGLQFWIIDHIVIAMSRHQLNEHDAARNELGKASEIFNRFAAQYPGTETQPSDYLWHMWIVCEQLLHEAEALIGEGP